MDYWSREEGLNQLTERLARAEFINQQFINCCSHTLRGPLTTIQGLINLAISGKVNSLEEKHFLLELIRKTSQQMEQTLRYLDQLLENHNRSLHEESIDFEAILKSVVKSLQPELKEFEITLITHVDQEGIFYGDKQRIKIICHHLLSNAIQFSDRHKEEKNISVSIRVTDQGANIRVKDNGIGIEPIHHEQIFDLFFRGSERSTGVGLGLYIVKEILEKIAGYITFQSRRNVGSEFLICLPHGNLLELQRSITRVTALPQHV